MQKLNKKRNPIAKQLRHYKNKITKNKRLYDRKKQHLINNIWFNNILKQLKKDGFLYVPNINKSFNKQGQEIK